MWSMRNGAKMLMEGRMMVLEVEVKRLLGEVCGRAGEGSG